VTRLSANKRGAVLLCLTLVLAGGCNSSTTAGDQAAGQGANDGAVTLRIGCQKSSLLLNHLRASADLTSRLGSNVQVVWKEFPAGPQLLEALSVGAIDLGHAGETPPVFAQAAGVPLVYVACEDPSPQSEAIVVLKDSPIQSVEQLKGKRVALNKGSNVHYLLVQALEHAGLTYQDIEPVFLPPADARVAFESGSVDAWAVWDPFFAVAESAGGTRVLVNGENLVSNRGFYLASRKFATEHPDVLQQLIVELARTSDWVSTHADEAIGFISNNLGIDQDIIRRAEQRRKYGVHELEPEIVQTQQQVADTFFRVGLIGQKVDVSTAVWRPTP